jgi:pimeloyl-ACP methyl ester carboxylesterase
MNVSKIKTAKLHFAFEESGPEGGERIFLVHGWPDSPRTWDKLLPALHGAGYRTVAPYLRGYGASRFNDPLLGHNQRRTGQPVAFAQDIVELADRLGMEQFHFIGHDWGARTGHALAALFPERLKSLVTISVPFEPGKAEPPKFPQARAFWYQWLLCTIPGETKFREDPVAFGRAQWDAWSPAGWYTEAEFKETADSWEGDDFPEVVLHSYRSRWGHAELDSEYAELQKRFESTETIGVPTVLIHGELDHCELLETTEGAEKYFTGGYRRDVISGAGHFPQREAPERVGSAILDHLAAQG